VSEKIKRKRADAVMAVQQEISMQLNQQKVGQDFKVLIDRKEGEYYVGRTEFDSPDVDNEVLIKVDSETYLRIGDFTDVNIYEASDFDLYGKVK
jgi:ribosomal protein S12 methylthiotransferase